MRIAVVGALGRMGRSIIEEAHRESGFEISGLIEAPGSPHLGAHLDEVMGSAYPHVRISPGWTPLCEGTEVMIDFSSPEGTARALDLVEQHGIPLVCGTTGLPEPLRRRLLSTSEKTAVLYAPNMSTGMHLMKEALRTVTGLLPSDWDVEIIEVHHKMKKDSPSGTALALSDVIRGARSTGEGEGSGTVRIHSLRAGQVPGVHTSLFAGPGEILEIVHTVHARAAFARGALAAARFLKGKAAGWYNMDDIYKRGNGGGTRG